jgi:hypothetical protein
VVVVAVVIRRVVPTVAVFGALVALTAWTGTRLDAHRAAITLPEEFVYLPDAARLRPLALGYDNVLADLVWFRTIDYFGAHYTSDRAYPWLEAMCDLVTDLDPRAKHVYRFAALVLPWEAHDPDAAIRLLEKGVRALPEAWTLPYHLGVIQYLFKHDLDAAAAHLARAAEIPRTPPFVARFAAILQTRQQGPQTAIAMLERMRDQATTPHMREVIERSLADARAVWEIQTLERTVGTYRERHGRFPTSPEQLVEAGLLRSVPKDPFEGVYEIDPQTGAVRSSTGRVPLELHTSPLAERLQNGEHTP